LIKVYQTKFGVGGDCLRASLASYFEISIDEVPSFELFQRNRWRIELLNWLLRKGYTLLEQRMHPSDDCFYLMLARTPNGVLHCVVNRNGRTVHDPTPNHATDLEMEKVWLFEPLTLNSGE